MGGKMANTIILGEKMGLREFMSAVRGGASVEFTEAYRKRVNRSRFLVEQAITEGRVIYGVTTGFGALSTRVINSEDAEQLQKNIILSHSTSVGRPFSKEEARGVMLMILQNLGQGYSGVRLEILESLREMLNSGLTPWMPGDGSVGYLAPEAHLALVITGEGMAYWQNELMAGREALAKAGIKPLSLASKEGLALISGTTSVTALGAIALYDMIQAAKCADIIGSLSLEALRGVTRAFDERVMSVRPHVDQLNTAANIRRILSDSGILQHFEGSRLQDALSLRCIPQLHGAAKKTLYAALDTIETEMNSCCDNPVIWDTGERADVISACNCDSSYVGIAMDSASIAATMLAKMSERRNNRFIDEHLSGYPAFLVKKPGLNSGLMIPQYTQAGLLGEMRILSTPSTVDNTPTCCNQEDYVAMGYNSSKKAIAVAEKLEYILAIELLSGYQAQKFIDGDLKRSTVTDRIVQEISRYVPDMEEDMYLYPHIEHIKDIIHSGKLLAITESIVGEIK